MNILSMLVESFSVANKMEKVGSRAGLEGAQRFAEEFCSQNRERPSETARSGAVEMIDGAFMRLL